MLLARNDSHWTIALTVRIVQEVLCDNMDLHIFHGDNQSLLRIFGLYLDVELELNLMVY